MSDSTGVNADAASMNSRDGWRVKEFESSMDDSISLWLEFVLDGVVQEGYAYRLKEWPADSCENSGERKRLYAVARAVARFANLGGDTQELRDVIQTLEDTGLTMGWEEAGWFVLDTFQEPGDTAEVRHYFLRDDRVLVWAEDSSVEEISLDDLYEELSTNEDESLLDQEGVSGQGPDHAEGLDDLISGPDGPGRGPRLPGHGGP